MDNQVGFRYIIRTDLPKEVLLYKGLEQAILNRFGSTIYVNHAVFKYNFI